jgi:toxin-antitoxin system PIN domain toxin
MILPDVNLLIFAHNESDKRFNVADKWFASFLIGPVPACFCWETINGFIRLSTNSKVMSAPLSLEQAFSIVRYWLEAPNSILLRRTPRHLEILDRISIDGGAQGPLFSDAVLATIAVENNATLATSDSDFKRFTGLRVIDPLAGPEH